MARQGLNCTFSYRTRKGKQFNYRVRCVRLTKGYSILSDESQARTSKAFYPRRTAPTGFGVQIALKGARERNSFNRYMIEYAKELLAESGTNGEESIQMKVEVPSRNFLRKGIPMTGIEFGTIVGEMLWQPVINFETSREPLDWNAQFDISSVQAALAGMKDEASRYFYPTGIQLAGEDQAAAIMEAVNSAADSDPDGTDFGEGPGF